MSRNSKNARKLMIAKSLVGVTGPAKTQPKHGKKNAWFQRGTQNKPKPEEVAA